MGRALTLKQKLFIEHYLETRNGVEAARRAGYKGEYAVLGVQAFENLKNPKIQTEIERRLKPFILSANGVLNLLSAHANGSMDMVLDLEGRFDLNKARENGAIRLIKKIKLHKDTGTISEVELHDPQSASVHLGKYWKLFTERVEITDTREQAKSALSTILEETDLPQDKAVQIVAARFGISETELTTERIM